MEGTPPSSAGHDDITWYRLREDIDHRTDRTVWLKIKSDNEFFERFRYVYSDSGLADTDAAEEEEEGATKRISHVLLPAKTQRRRLQMEDRIEVFSAPRAEDDEAGPTVTDARFWRQLRARRDLGPSTAPASRLRVRPFGPSIFSFDDCWQLTPLDKELNPERHVAKDEVCRRLERALTQLEKRLRACSLRLWHYLSCRCLQSAYDPVAPDPPPPARAGTLPAEPLAPSRKGTADSASTDGSGRRRVPLDLREPGSHSASEPAEGRLMHLVLPLSWRHSTVSGSLNGRLLDGAEEISGGDGIGIGAELYFMQVG